MWLTYKSPEADSLCRKVNISLRLGTIVQESQHYSDIDNPCAGKSTLVLRLCIIGNPLGGKVNRLIVGTLVQERQHKSEVGNTCAEKSILV